MTTPTSGQISASDIINEFGNSNSNGGMSLGAYPVSYTHLTLPTKA